MNDYMYTLKEIENNWKYSRWWIIGIENNFNCNL